MVNTDQKTIRLLIVDDHALFRESVARLLQSEPGFDVVAHYGSGAEALRVLKSSAEIDVVLLDLDLGNEHGADFLDHLRKLHFRGKVLLVTAGVNDNEVPGLIRKGISGVFLKHGAPASLTERIRDAAAGKVLFGQDMLRRALEEAEAASSERTPSRLTERERQVLSFVFEGLANKQIPTGWRFLRLRSKLPYNISSPKLA